MLTPLGIYRLITAISKYGINPLALLQIAANRYKNRVALVDENETLTYNELGTQINQLAILLKQDYHLQQGQKVGLICKNHNNIVKAIFALSGLGVDLYLLNSEMSSNQFHSLLEQHDFQLLIYDQEWEDIIAVSSYTRARLLAYHDDLPAMNHLLARAVDEKQKLKRASFGRLVILTGGTTGRAKEAAHRPSIFNYLNPFIAFVTRLNVNKQQTAYIATPIYHGYGVAVLLLLIAIGKKIVICRKFEATNACRLIREHQVEFITVVPLMLHKLLKHNVDDLRSLACIASGGAELNPRLVEETLNKLGPVLYNLYGTSEAGLNCIATPQDLMLSPKTIGRIIEGVRLQIVDAHMKRVEIGRLGQFCITNRWSMTGRKQSLIETGDIGYRDERGLYYLCGRVDDMVVSAGENVYPIEVEHVLIHHPHVEDVAVIGVADEVFGQRLKAFVLCSPDAHLSKAELLDWLRPRVARYQMPREIIIVDEMPYTAVGKLNKKLLRQL